MLLDIFDLGQKFNFKKFSTFIVGSFLIELTFLSQMITFLEISIINGSVGSKKKISDNPGHNSLELSNILVQVRFTSSKTRLAF